MTFEPIALTDDQLMTDAAAGSVAAFSEIYDRYCSRAYRVAWVVCRDHGNAQDAVQEAFVSIWKASGSYRRQRGTVAGWVLTVVRYRAIDLARRNQAVVSRQASVSHLDDFPAPGNPSEQILRHAESDQLLTLLDRLPDTQREVITLAYYGQLTHTEIASKLGLPAGTVKGRMRLGMHKLRAQMEQAEASRTAPVPDRRDGQRTEFGLNETHA